ncbi:unnamed protein product [Brassica napus]|uniref:(rape) hypothetical protein n=2 Tax=Brassica TaxID=3705 RepID=A0A816RFF1_BRANA|nr:unnamed protein product [Brassica napus]
MTYNGVNGVVKLLFPELKASDVFIGMVKTKAERYTKYDGSYKMEKILEFLGKKKFPLITKSSESNTAWVYSTSVKLQVMIFAKADDFQSMAQPLEDIARRFKSKLMFIYIDITNENLAMPFLTLFGIEDANKTVDAVLKEKCKIDLCVVRITGSSNMFEESWLMLILQAVTTTGCCEESMLSLRHRTDLHDVGRGKVKVSVIKMQKKTTTIGDQHLIIRLVITYLF